MIAIETNFILKFSLTFFLFSKYLAKNNAVENFENSEGWNLKSYIEIQEVDPEIVIP